MIKKTDKFSIEEEKKLPVANIYEVMGISKPALYGYVREAQEAGK